MAIFDISIFGLHIAPSWYGAMYAFGFIICYFFIKRNFLFTKKDHIDSLLTYIFFGVIIGGRIGYAILYNPTYFFENPVEILFVWKGGMSFHGGFIGTIIAVLLFCKKYQYKFWELIDIIAVIIPVAIGLGRIGNWINKELPGYTPYNGIFPMNIQGVNHFPSPLFEMLLEGILLFIIMIISYKLIKHARPGIPSGIFLVGYGTARIFAEGYRLPDTHIGYIFGSNFITIGMIYTIPIILSGVYILYIKRN